MTRSLFLSLAVGAALSAGVAAQNCTDNQYPVTLTDSNGNPAQLVVDPQTNESYYQFATEDVYMAFDPNLPSGTYYVHVTDPIGGVDMVLSTNDPMDRFVQVTNTAGVITLSLPFSSNTPVTGLGLGGVGESLLLQPFTTNPGEPCRFKAWLGDWWDLSNGPENPWLLRGGFNPNTGSCAVRSYSGFRIGDGTGTDITGCVFDDLNGNGVQDQGEPGLPGWSVDLDDGTSTTSVTTDATGCYAFVDVASGSYTVQLAVQSGYTATTPLSHQLEICGCADVGVAPFGVMATCLATNGHTIGFWRNCRGMALVDQYGILAMLPALGIVDGCGNRVAPGTLAEYRRWLRRARAYNMAYMLSAQLVAMHNNVTVGFVSPNAVIEEPGLGQVSIANLMQLASASLWANPFTPPCSTERGYQALLKDALDHANNNTNWVTQSCGAGSGTGGGHHSGHHRRNGRRHHSRHHRNGRRHHGGRRRHR